MDEFDFGVCIDPLLEWFRQNARALPWRENPDAYRVWVSEIMLQQTRVEAVKPYYERFLRELPDVEALADCPEDRLLKLWEGLGYYNRVRNMQKAARVIMQDYGGIVPQEYDRLLELPGIGHYTAGAIVSIAYGKPHPAVDGNVLRVLTRLTGDDSDIAKQSTRNRIEDWLTGWLQAAADGDAANMNAGGVTGITADVSGADVPECMGQMVGNPVHPGMLNQALMELGALVCLPNGEPHCEVCPWKSCCIAYRDGRTADLPVKTKTVKRRIEPKTVLLVCEGDKVAICKRADKGLLAGLYELPNCEGHLTSDEAVEYVRRMGYDPLQVRALADAKHIFSHIEWHMIGYAVRIADIEVQSERTLPLMGAEPEETASRGPAAGSLEGIPDWIFADAQDVAERYAIPAAFARYTAYLDAAGRKTGKEPDNQDRMDFGYGTVKSNADAGASA